MYDVQLANVHFFSIKKYFILVNPLKGLAATGR